MRKARGITLKTLASEIDRSVGWLSQLERGQTSPSVRDLDVIADYFGIDVSFFFRGSTASKEEQGLVRRSTDRVPVGKLTQGLTEELLSPALSGSFEMLMSVFDPHHDGEGSMPARSTEEGGVVISGQLTLIIGDVVVTLKPGDSVQFTDTEYTWKNEGDVPAVVFWVISPPVLRGDTPDLVREQ